MDVRKGISARQGVSARQGTSVRQGVVARQGIKAHTPQPVEERPVVLAKYNDPKQINTVLDLIFNTAALETRYKSAGLGARFKAMQDMLMEQYVNPVIAGEWGVVGLNTLFSLGESVDVLGNVVKSITAPLINKEPAIYDDLTLSERIKSSIGIGEHGRINYDYATGDLFTDIVLEVVSDPSTWVTMGSSMLAKTTAKSAATAAKETVKKVDGLLLAAATDDIQRETIKQTMEVFAKEVGNKEVMRDAVRILRGKADAALKISEHKEFIETFLGGAIKTKGAADTVEVQTLADALTLALKSKGLLQDVDAITARQMSDLFERSVNTAVNRTTIQALKVADTAVDVTNKIETTLMQAVPPLGLYPAYKIIKNGFPSVGRWINAQLTNAAKAKITKLGDITPMDFWEALPLMQKANLTIKDALSRDTFLFTNYQEPMYTAALYSRISKDTLFFTDVLDKYANDPVSLRRLMNQYLEDAHRGATLDEYITMMESIQAYLKSMDTPDVVVDKHLAYLRSVRESFKLTDEQVTIRKSLEEMHKTEEELHKAALALFYRGDEQGRMGIISKAFKQTKVSIAEAIKIRDKPVVLTWQETKLDTLASLKQMWQYNAEQQFRHSKEGKQQRFEEAVDYFADELFDMLETEVTKVFLTLNEQISKNNFERNSILTLKLNNALFDVREILDEVLALPAKLRKAKNMGEVETILDTQPYVVRFNTALNQVNQAITVYDTKYAGKLLKDRNVDATSLQQLIKDSETAASKAGIIMTFLGKLKHKASKDPNIKLAYDSYGIKAYQMLANVDKRFSAKDVNTLKQKIIAATIDKKSAPTLTDIVELNVPKELIDQMHAWDEQAFDVWLNTPLNDSTYVDAWYDVTRSLQNLRDNLIEEKNKIDEEELITKLGFDEDKWKAAYEDGSKRADGLAKKQHLQEFETKPKTYVDPTTIKETKKPDDLQRVKQVKHLADLENRLNILEHAVEFLKPSDFALQQTMIDADTHYITAKYEQLHTFLQLVTNDDLVYVMSELKAGNLRSYLDTLDDEATDEVLRIVETFYSTKGLIQSLANAPIQANTRAGTLATIQKQYFSKPDYVLAYFDAFMEKIKDGTQTFIQQTFQAKDRLNLDYIRTIDEKDYAAFRVKLGLPPKGTAHDALDDIITSLYLIQKQADEGYEPAKSLLDSKLRVISLDLETQNLNKDSGNTLHQISVTSFQEGTLLSSEKHGLVDHVIKQGLMPDPAYLAKLGITAEDYLKHYAGEELTEANLVMQLYRGIHKALQGTFDTTDQVYRAVLNTHNGTGFDLQLLPAKVEQYDLRKALQAEGIDPDILSKLEPYDTFEHGKKQLGYFEMSTEEYNIVHDILYQYVDEMNMYGVRRIFSAPSSSDLQTIMAYLKNIQKQGKNSKQNMRLLQPEEAIPKFASNAQWSELNTMLAKLQESFSEYQRIKETNQAFRKELIPAAILTNKVIDGGKEVMNPELKEMLLAFFKDSFGEEHAAKVIGDGKNITPNMLFGAFGGAQTMAYKNFYRPDKVNNYFVASTKPLTRYQASVRMGVTKTLERYASQVKYAKLYVPYMDKMQNTIQKLMQYPEFAYLQDLRLTNLNVQQTYAIFKFVVRRFQDKQALPVIVGPNMVSLANRGFNYYDWTHVNHYAKRMAEGTYYNEVHMYEDQLENLLSLRSSINEYTTYLDKAGLSDASAQLNMVAASPALHMLEKLVDVLSIDRHTMQVVRGRIAGFTRNIKNSITSHFIMANADETVNWLAHSKGMVYISKNRNFDYRTFISKLSSQEFVDSNILFEETQDAIWVWLTRDAKWDALVHDGKVVYYANGKQLEPSNWRGFTSSMAYEISKDLPNEIKGATDAFVADFVKAYERLMYMTDNQAGMSTLEELGQKQFIEALNYMPLRMKETFYDDIHLKKRQMWQGPQYNHSFLGETNKVVDIYASDIVSNLAKTTERQIMNHTTATRYTAALLDPMLGIAKSGMADLYQTDPEAVFQYFKQHPEIVLTIPMSSPKGKLGYRVEEVVIKKPADLKYAFDNNARFTTSTVHNKLYEVLNEGVYSDSLIGHWQAILRMFKIGYMFNPGTWAKNSYDTFIKNMFMAKANPAEVSSATAAGIQSIADYDQIIKSLYKIGEDKNLPSVEIQKLLINAAMDHSTYHDIAEQLYRLNKFQPLEDMAVEHVKAFLEGYPRMPYDRFMQIHKFSMTAAAGGESGVYSKMSSKQAADYVDDLVSNGGMTSKEAASIKRKRSYQHLTSAALTPMNYVERVARLAEFDMLTKKGYNTTQANHIVEKTHFSYDTKTPIEQTMELMIPFYTFISRNFEFWSDALELNPGYMSIMRDVLEPIWDLGQYDEDELQDNESLQRQVLMGNLPIAGTDFYLSTGFSFMDALEWVTQPVPNAFSSMFSPIATVVGAAMQNLSDGAYAEGHALLSNWLQGTFGGDRSLAQLEDKYGSWTNTYRTLYGDLSERRTTQERLNKIAYAINLIPLVGSVLSRMYKTGVFYDEEDGIGKIGYLLGLATKASRWQDFADKDSKSGAAMATYASQIYQLLQAGGENVWAYTRLKNALGYQDVSLKDLPEDVKALILNAMTGAPIQVDVIPVLKDSDTMRLLWESALRKHNAPFDLDEAPQELLNEIYLDIAQSAVSLASIMTMLQNDESTRYSYAVAKSSLGLKEVKLSMLPNEALEVIEHAMLVRYYGTGPSTGNRAAGAPSRRRGYPRKSYHQMSYVKGSGTGLYDTRKGVYPNYGHRSAQKVRIYDKHYTKTGKSRMELRMMPITPVNLSYRRKDMFYYYK